MSIITISRGSYRHAKEVAEKVAKKLGYEYVAREILLEASREFNIPEIKLIKAIGDPPSVFERFTQGRQKYIAYIEAAVLKNLQRDNVVYHGLAGHFFVRSISHVLRVRINANIEDRAKIVMEREGISHTAALKMVRRIDRARRKWSKQLYGIDSWHSTLYDLVINVERITVDDAVHRICRTVALDCFKTTPESQRAMDDIVLAAEANAALITLKSGIEVSAKNGVVYLKTKARKSKRAAMTQAIEKTVTAIPGLRDIRIDFMPTAPSL